MTNIKVWNVVYLKPRDKPEGGHRWHFQEIGKAFLSTTRDRIDVKIDRIPVGWLTKPSDDIRISIYPTYGRSNNDT